jgi:hypothetical protein
VRDYTREAGVRNLERQIGAVLPARAVRIAEGETTQRIAVDVADLAASSGAVASRTRLRCAPACPASPPGWRGRRSGGDILFIEASPHVPGNGRLILTGQLGDVMKESAQAALTLVKSRARVLGHRPGGASKTPTSMCTCRPARSRRTDRARACDVRGARVAVRRSAGAQRHRDDRRDQPARAWCCRWAASRKRCSPRCAAGIRA